MIVSELGEESDIFEENSCPCTLNMNPSTLLAIKATSTTDIGFALYVMASILNFINHLECNTDMYFSLAQRHTDSLRTVTGCVAT